MSEYKDIRTESCRRLFSSATNFTDFPPIDNDDENDDTNSNSTRGQRVWKAHPDRNHKHYFDAKVYHWNEAVDDVKDRTVVDESLARICEQVRVLFMCAVYIFTTFIV